MALDYNNTLLTPRDCYHLHFKHITHRRIGTNNRYDADRPCPSTCRFCHKYEETSVHLGRCPCLKKKTEP